MTIAIDTPEITTEDVTSLIEAFILNNEAGQGEYAINYPKALLPDADAKEAYVTEAIKEPPRRKPVSKMLTSFRWLETIPYLNIIIEALRKLRVPILKRPGRHNTITSGKIIEITALTPKKTAEIPSIHSNRSPSM